MFSWFAKLFRKPAPPLIPQKAEEDFSTYKVEERQIYSYPTCWDNSGLVHRDPMVLYKKLMEVAPELSIDIKVANSPSKDAADGQNKALRKIKTIFDVKEMEEDGKGLTQAQILGLFDNFLLYVDQVKKNSRKSAILSNPPAFSSPPPNGQAIPPSSEYGSTAGESSAARPNPLPSGQQLP
jgi:hypothetical protein